MLVMEMSSKTQKNPSIRFKGFTDAWEQRKLGETVDYIIDNRGKNPKSYTEDGIPVIDNFMIQNNRYPNLNKTNRFIDAKTYNYFIRKYIEENDILVTLVGNGIGNIALAPKTLSVIIQNTLGFRFSNYDYNFMYYSLLFESPQIKKLDRGMAQPSIRQDELLSIDLNIPEFEEQQKIGQFFKKIDDTIALHQRQQDNYKQLKKYMLQKIFNQEFRFKDKNGNDYPDWEEIALKELGETFTGLSGKTKENFGKGKGKFVTYMNVFSNSTANLAMTENVEIKDGEKQNEVRYGDIFFTTSSETPDEVGMSSVWLSHESNVYLNSFCFGYRLNSESEGKVTHQFLGVQLRADRIRKQIVFLAQGSTRFNISKAKLTEIPVYLPAIQEQQKIADFLSMLDLRIEQLSQKVELLKEQKKGLIQQMFV